MVGNTLFALISAILASLTVADVIQVSSSTYLYHIQRQAERCLDFLDFKEEFTVSTMRKTWTTAEHHYGGLDVDTHPDELPPAHPGTLEGDMQLFYSICQRCVTGINHLIIDLSMHHGNGFHLMQNILNFEDQVAHLLNLLEGKLEILGITPANNVTQQLLTTANYQHAKTRNRKQRDFAYLSHCLEGLEFINVVSVEH